MTRQYAQHFLVALWGGAGAGVIVGATIAVRYVSGIDQPVGVQSVWLAPLACAALMIPAGLGLAALATRCPPELAWRITVGVTAALVTAQILFLVQGLNRYTVILLVSGVGVRSMATLGRRPESVIRLASRTLLPILAGSFILGVGFRVSETWREARSLGRMPGAPSGAPNVLLIILDTVREQSLGLYGHRPNTTPELEAWARHATVFRRAYAAAAWTAPSHASLFTGQLASKVLPPWPRPLDPAATTIAGVLSSHGYTTAAFIGNFRTVSSQTQLTRGFAHVEGHPLSLAEAWITTSLGRKIMESGWGRRLARFGFDSRKSAQQVDNAFLAWIDGQTRRPFFVFLNYFDAHNPYFPPEPFDTLFGSTRTREVELNQLASNWPADELERQRRAYEGSIAGLDREIGRLLGELSRRHLLDSTLVIIASDHGEQFGEHGLVGHGNSLYPAVLRVPLALALPGVVPEDTSIDETVSLMDLPATIMDLAGLGAQSPFGGASLARHWQAAPSAPGPSRPVLAELETVPGILFRAPGSNAPLVASITNRWHYILNDGGKAELYDLQADSAAATDLAARSDLGDTLRLLDRAIQASPRAVSARPGP